MWGASNLPVVSTLGTVGSPPASPKTHRGQQRWWIGPPPPPRTQPWPENSRENGQKAHPSSSFIQASKDPKSSMGCKNTSFMNKDMRESVTWSVCSSLPGGRGMPMPSTADAPPCPVGPKRAVCHKVSAQLATLSSNTLYKRPLPHFCLC